MYTTTKRIGKLTNQLFLSWFMIGGAIIRLILKGNISFDSFKAIGNFLDVLLMICLGIIIMIYSNKNINKIKGIEFDINEKEFIYKTVSRELKFNTYSPAKNIKKTLETIEIKTQDDNEIKINLDDFLLDFKELKRIDRLITALNIEWRTSQDVLE
ncbi:MAG: hypothetical protein ACPG4W_05565 [Flavobacteriales bacterium]